MLVAFEEICQLFGVFSCVGILSYVAKSILWTVIGCWPSEWVY